MTESMKAQDPEALEALYRKTWDNLHRNTKELCVYLASLGEQDTHSDPETLQALMGVNEALQSLHDLSSRGLLTALTTKSELQKVAKGEGSVLAPGGKGWSVEQAKKVLENINEHDSVHNLPHFRLISRFNEFVNSEIEKNPTYIYNPETQLKEIA